MTRSTAQEGITSHLLFDTVPTSSPSATTDPVDCPFIVRVRRSSDQAFLGTAFFVSPTLAIGCLHYLQTKDLRGQLTDVHTDVTLDWGTHQVVGRLQFKDVERDFVAIRVDEPPAERTIPTARLAENIDATTLENLCAPRNLFIKGYLGREGGAFRHKVEIRNKPLVQTEREHGVRPFLRDAQFPGGLMEGLSGSPLLARHDGEWIVLGMAYLGGEKSGNSRVLLADVILELLTRECPDAALLKPVPAQQLVKDIQSKPSLGTSIQEQPVMPSTASVRIGWLRRHMPALVWASALTLIAQIYALSDNDNYGAPELFFLLLVFYAVVLSVRWLWARIMEARREKM